MTIGKTSIAIKTIKASVFFILATLATTRAAGLTTWERSDEVRRSATLVVVERPGANDATPPEGWSWVRVEAPRLEVSSTDLRARFTDGRPLDYLVTEPVLDVIEARQLYRGSE